MSEFTDKSILNIEGNQNFTTLELLFELILSCLLRNKTTQKEPLALPPFLPKRCRQKHMLQEGILDFITFRISPLALVRKTEPVSQTPRVPLFLSRPARISALPQLPVNCPFSPLKSNTPSLLLLCSKLSYIPNDASLSLWSFLVYGTSTCACLETLMFLC